MNIVELIEFDTLRYKQERTIREETRYRELEQQVTLNTKFEGDIELHKELCSTIAARFFKDLAVYGPEIANSVMDIVAQVIKVVR